MALKGAEKFIADWEGNSCLCRRGNVGLATSGSGDVLAGVITGLLARGAYPFPATCWGDPLSTGTVIVWGTPI